MPEPPKTSASLPPRWFIRLFWVGQRAVYSVTRSPRSPSIFPVGRAVRAGAPSQGMRNTSDPYALERVSCIVSL